jgi:hypothetical protein
MGGGIRAAFRRVFPSKPLLKRKGDNFDVLDVARLRAAFDSAAYYEAHMLGARAFKSKLDLLQHAASLISVEGLVLEFGVGSGLTINHIAGLIPGPVYGFDSFDGLPEHWRTGYPTGTFAGPVPEVRANVKLIKGLFSDTLPGFTAENGTPIALLHIDCDLYSSTKTVLEGLGHRIGKGCVIVFDEYFNYAGWRQHEHKAFREFAAKSGLSYRYEGLVRSDEQVCVVVEGRTA